MAGKLLTREEAAERCRISLGTFDSRVRPHLRVRRVGARVLIPESEIERWIEATDTASEGEGEQQSPVSLPETATHFDRKQSEESGTFASAKPWAAESEVPEPRISAKLKKLEIACMQRLSPGRLRSALREPHEHQSESEPLPEALQDQESLVGSRSRKR
jgi:excisionase family DNA binding protein